MAGIKDVMSDVLQQLASIRITNTNDSGSSMTPYVRVWNNQIHLLRQQKIEGFQLPALFLEVQNQTRYEVMGQAYRNADITCRIHLVHEYLNDGFGVTYEQDLIIFDLRDRILKLLTYFTPSGCGPMVCMVEDQDFDHDNIYHLTLDFITNFTDSKASRLDPESDYYIDSPVPLNVEADVSLVTDLPPNIAEKKPFIIPQL